jgi:Xaa-Pro aminopeptidase
MTKISSLIKQLSAHNIDYFLLPNSDQFLNEYLPNSEKRIEFLTNFDGSNAFIILNKKQSYFFTDSRYLIAAKQQIDRKIFKIIDIAKQNPQKFLQKNCQNKLITFDPQLHSAKFIYNLKNNDLNLRSIYDFFEQNPIDKIWQDREILKSEIFLHKEKFTGVKYQDKIAKIYDKISQNSDAIFIISPESCSYLFNIRSFIIDYVPTCPSFAIISKNKDILLFLEEENMNIDVKESLKNVKITNFDNLSQKISDFCNQNNIKNIEIDLNQTNYHIFNILQKCELNITDKIDPVILQKAIKNKTEINGMKVAHKKDGIAVSKFIDWIKKHPNQSEISEIIAAEKLLEFRKEDPDFIYPSFETISGFAENSAIIHYKVTEKTNKYFDKNSIYLVDSGGQYQYGTTDITRSIAIGEATEQQRIDFTLILKGHIALARAKFPIGTKAHQLDILARQFLWQEGKNYGHGTGHGVGYFLNVHEGPCSISPKYNEFPLEEGMILSNEPGFYIENQYGIRIENLILVKKSEIEGFLEFETITLAPFDFDLIDLDMLSQEERDWIDDYYDRVSFYL